MRWVPYAGSFDALKEVRYTSMARTAAEPRPGTDENRKLNIVLPGKDFGTVHAYAKEHGLPLTIALRDMITFFREVHDELDDLGPDGEIVVRPKQPPAAGDVKKIPRRR